jgi:hypothetical protein
MMAEKHEQSLSPSEQEGEVLERLQHVTRMLRRRSITPRKILDIAGNPTTSAHWAVTFPEAQVFCLNVRKVEHSPHLGIHDLTHDLLRSPPDVSDCDFIFAGEIIEHVYDLAAFTRNMLSAAADGAHVAITTPNLAAWTNRLLLLCGQAPSNYDAIPITMPRLTWLRAEPRLGATLSIFDYHIRVFTQRQLAFWLEQHGIEVLEQRVVMSTVGRWASDLKRMLDRVLPQNLKDTLVVLGRYTKA